MAMTIEQEREIELAKARAAAAGGVAAQPSTAGDMLRSAGAGLRSGIEGLAGMAGDLNQMGGQGAAWLAEKIGASPETAGKIGTGVSRMSPFFGAPGREQVGKDADAVIGDTLKHQPQTTAGEYARTIGEFAPAAVAGPGSLLRKGMMATIPALASETAGQATEGTAIEPAARAVGALAGGMASAGRVNPVAAAAKGAPTREVLKSQTDQLYDGLRKAGIRYDADSFTRTVHAMSDDLLKEGLRPSVAKEAFGLVDDLMKQLGHSPDFDDINGLVQTVGGAARAAERAGNGPLAKGYHMIRDKLDDFERTAPLITNQPISGELLNRARSTARALALKNIKARALDDVMKNADTYQSGMEAGIRNGISNLVRSKKGASLFSGEERTALLQVAQGRKALRTLSRFGLDVERLAGNATALPTVGAGVAYGVGGPLAAAGLAATGTAAKLASPRLTQRAFDQTAAAVRSGKLNTRSGIEATKKLRDDQLIRRLLAGEMGLEASR